jgi:hypothetical protein
MYTETASLRTLKILLRKLNEIVHSRIWLLLSIVPRHEPALTCAYLRFSPLSFHDPMIHHVPAPLHTRVSSHDLLSLLAFYLSSWSNRNILSALMTSPHPLQQFFFESFLCYHYHHWTFQSSLLSLWLFVYNHREHRVPGFLPSRPNWVPPNPSPARECCSSPLGVQGGRDTLVCKGGGPNSDEGTDTLVQ